MGYSSTSLQSMEEARQAAERAAAARVGRRAWLGRFVLPAAGAAGLAACASALPLGLSLSSARDLAPAAADPEELPEDEGPVGPAMEPLEQPVEEPPPPAPRTIPVYYRPEYTLSGYSYETTRKAAWVADSLAAAPLPNLELVSPELLSEGEIAVVHDPAYIRAVKTGEPRQLAQSQGWPWDPGLFPMVQASNGGAVAAAQAALKLGVAGSLSSGLHHARRARGNGNCTFNGLALAVRALRAAGAGRILILDLDAHCGGGTDELLGTDAGVHITDVSVYAFDVYTPQGRNTLDMVQRAPDYLPAIRRRMEALDGRAFDVCLYNAGMDPHEGCSLGGLRGITTEMLAERERLVFDWCRQNNLAVAFVMAGGYTGNGLDTGGLTGLHRLTLSAASQMPLRAA